MRKALTYPLLALLAIFVAPAVVHAALWLAEGHPRSWRNADWSSAGTLPSPSEEREASIRVMAARTGGLKGAVSVHTWLLLKSEGAASYERYEVVGWGSPVRRNGRPPDGRWYSNEPVAIYTLKGAEAARLIPKVEAAIRDYRWSERGAYRIWPGPNSNTFVATVLAAVPEPGVKLPPTAIGRDYPAGPWFAHTPSGGFVLSLGGYAGLRVGLREGFELNLLGLVAGIRFDDFAILLPGFGALGEPF
ncbi:MAG: DUF3750 domain-containing protein [Propylenella sp.]